MDRRTVLASVAATIGTLILTSAVGGGFQYISWRNSVRLQSATEQAVKAEEIYKKAALSIATRNYETLTYLAAAQSIVNKKDKGDNDLSKAVVEENQKIVTSYHDTLRTWYATYDALLTDIDYNLDRPIFGSARMSLRNLVRAAQTSKIDCAYSLNEQMDKKEMDKHSLKRQFAVIAACFRRVTTQFDALTDKSSADRTVVISDKVRTDAEDRLGALLSMSNVFRCYALQRIDYYDSLKELSIISPSTIYQRIIGWRRQKAQDHFKTADAQCGLS